MVRHKSGPRTTLIVRLDPSLLALVDETAKANELSRNAMITHMLRHALAAEGNTR